MEARWRLTGRTAEVTTGVAAVRSGRGVLVAGPRGVGRSRVAAEVVDRAGASAVRVTATSAARTTPLGALAPILVGGEATSDLERAHAGLLAAAGTARPVLVVDDAHLLDDASASVVLHLASSGSAIVVATTVVGAPASDAVTALWKGAHLARIDLAPLPDDDIAALVDAELDPAVEGPARHALVAAAAGSPQALAQLIDDARASGTLFLGDGVWRLRGPLGWGGRFADLVAGVLADVDDEERDALELVAVAGRIGVGVLERLVAPDVLERLERDGHLTSTADGARLDGRLSPQLDHGVLRAQLSALRVRWLSRRLADAFADVPCRRAGDRMALAVWRLDGGREVEGDELISAALDAARLYDPEVALRLARAAWTTTGRADAGHVLGRLLWLAGKHEAAESVLAEAVAAAQDDETLVHVTNSRATNLFRGLHDVDGAEAVFVAARERVADAECRDALDAHHAAVEVLTGDVASARSRTAHLLDPARPWPFVEAAVAGAAALALEGRTDEAATVAERAFTMYSGMPPRSFAQDTTFVHLMTLTTALIYGGRLDDADHVATLCYDGSLEHRATSGAAWFALLRGNTAEQRGALRRARVWFSEAADAFHQAGEDGMRRVSLAHVALVAAQAAARDDAERALEAVRSLDHTAVRLYDTVDARAAAWLDVLDGDVDVASHRLEAAVALDLRLGRPSVALAAVHDLARIGAAERAAALLAEVPPGDGLVLPLLRAHVAALAERDPDALDDVGTRFDDIGAALFAAEALAVAAAVRADAGEGRRAAALARRATALAQRCEGAATPGLAGLATVGARLTPREAELVALAARAVPNPDIAARLGLSVRTVENHLARAYAKLGVSGRGELRRVLADGAVHAAADTA